MRFSKYHGAGNDFIVVDNRSADLPEGEKAGIARAYCRRQLGIGADGLILVESSDKAQVLMRIFNPDGSEPAMCGNGVRCFAKYVYDKGIVESTYMSVETMAGVLGINVTVEGGEVTYVKVDMGKPVFERSGVPAEGEGELINETIEAYGKEVTISAVNTGVPHVVIFVENLEVVDVNGIGSAIRFNKDLFPQGANVNFLQRTGDNTYRVRTYERGVEDETLACGTGVTACGVVAVVLGEADPAKPIKIKALGGTIYIEVERDGDAITTAYMNGPVAYVFEGEVPL
jgi:diaminopimelate epimerase